MEPQAYLVTMFFAANVWSCLLVIGNPTNVIVATAFQLEFFNYSAWMGLPTIFAGVSLMLMLMLVFRRALGVVAPSAAAVLLPAGAAVEMTGAPPIFVTDDDSGASTASPRCETPDLLADRDFAPPVVVIPATPPAPVAASSASPLALPQVNWFSAWIGLSLLAVTLILMFALSFIKVPIWMLGLAFGFCMLTKDAVLDVALGGSRERVNNVRGIRKLCALFPTIMECVRRLPPDLIPFMLGMFILVEALKDQGIVKYIGDGLTIALANVGFNSFATVFLLGVSSTLACSVLNNQPMTILFSSIVASSGLPLPAARAAMFAIAIGSNFGANLSFVAALAGIMFKSILKPHNVTVTARFFCTTGWIVMPVVLTVALLVLSIEATIIGGNYTTA